MVDAEHKISPIPEGGLKIPFWLNFIHPCQEILGNVKEFVKKQLSKSKKSFKYDEDACSSSDDEERILAESDNMMIEKFEKVMNLQSNNLRNSLIKRIVNLITNKKKK